MKGVTDADQKAAAAFLQVAETRAELGKVSRRQNEFDGRFREIGGESRRRLIRLSTM